MVKEKLPTKACMSCGLEKPLNAFLQIAGPEGSSYGHVCSTCRGSGLGRKITLPSLDLDDQGSSSTGLKIDAKSKIQIDKDNREHTEKATEQHQDNLEKRLQEQEEKADEIADIEYKEKQHRDNYIESKKPSNFLNFQNKTTGLRTPFATQDKESATRRSFSDERKATAVGVEREEISKEERRKTTEDFSVPVLDHQHAQISRQNPLIEQWKAMVGETAAINTVNNIQRKFLNTSTNTKPAPEKPVASKDSAATPKNPAVDFIKETWENKPTTTRRR